MQLVDMEKPGSQSGITAREAGHLACRRCASVWKDGSVTCARCGKRLISRDSWSLPKVWIWWVLGLAALIPANLLPMIQTRWILTTKESTLLGGALDLALHDAYLIAAIVFVASFVIPVAKLGIIAFLALSVGRENSLTDKSRLRLFHLVEFVGRWSMVDIFVIAILSALVQLSILASIKPGPAALAFAASVIFTMLSAQSFDPRLIWDRPVKDTHPAPPHAGDDAQ